MLIRHSMHAYCLELRLQVNFRTYWSLSKVSLPWQSSSYLRQFCPAVYLWHSCRFVSVCVCVCVGGWVETAYGWELYWRVLRPTHWHSLFSTVSNFFNESRFDIIYILTLIRQSQTGLYLRSLSTSTPMFWYSTYYFLKLTKHDLLNIRKELG